MLDIYMVPLPSEMRKSITALQGSLSHALIFCFFQSLPNFPLTFSVTSSSPSVLQSIVILLRAH